MLGLQPGAKLMVFKNAFTLSTKSWTPENRTPADEGWTELSVVALTHDATGIDGVEVRKGSRGTIVSVWTPGQYAVEFIEPATVVNLCTADLSLIELAQ